MIKKILAIAIMALVLYSCSDNSPVNVEPTLEEKIGEMLIIGFRGLSVDNDSQIANDIKGGKIGGVILFDRDVALNSPIRNVENPTQVRQLISSLRAFTNRKLFVCVDQEGGYVARLKTKYGFPYNVSQQYLGNLDNIDSTRFYAEQTVVMLKDMGFNVNFAPVVDLNINPDNPVIGKIERSFSANPAIVVKHSEIMINKFKEYGILASLKHFPGHGSSTSDSHLGLTDVTNTWSSIELEPYKQLINNDFGGMIMTAHIFNSKLDEDYPATLSNKIITGILRNQLNYKGVIVSDDMNMGAITQNYGLESAIEQSINAGVDILIFANNLSYDEMIADKAIKIVLDLINSGKISKDRINESYERIKILKERL